MAVRARGARRPAPGLGAQLGIWAAFVIVLVAGMLAAWLHASDQHERTERQTTRSAEILSLLAVVERRTIDLQVGVRGYAIAPYPELLAPYTRSRAVLPGAFREVSELIADDQPAARDLALVRRRVDAYLDEIAEPFIAARPTLSARDVRRRVLESTSRMNVVRASFDALREAEHAQLTRRRAAQEAQEARTRSVGIAAVMGILAAIVVAAAGMFVGVIHPVRRMTHAARRVAKAGDVADLARGGRGEIAVLGSALQGMSAALRAHEADVVERRDFLDATLTELREAIVACDADGRLTVANPAARRLLGVALDVALDDTQVRSTVQLLTPDGQMPLDTASYPLATTLREGELHDMEFTVMPDGRNLRRAVCNGRALRDADGRVIGAVVAARDVTAERAVAEALRASEERHRVVLESVGEVVFETDADGRWTFLSPPWTTLTGAPVDATVGRRAIEFVHEDDRAAFRDWLADVLEQRLPTAHMRHRYRHASGEVRWAGVTLRLRYLPDGRPDGALGTMRDMTERIQAAQAVERLQRRNTWILESAGEGILGVDAEGAITFVNGAAARMTGRTAEELEGRSIFEAFATGTVLRDALRTGDAASAEAELARSDGTEIPIEFTASPILESDVVTGGVVVFRDVTEQRRTTAELEREREFQAALLESLHDGIVACDADGIITLQNRANSRLLGIDLTTPPDFDAVRGVLLHSDGQTPLADEDLPLARALRGEEVRDVEIAVAPPGEPVRWVVSSGRVIRDADGRKLGAVIASHDVTERRRAERLKDEFLALVSHELRTPLTSIVGYVEMLMEDGADADTDVRDRFLGVVQRNARRLLRLVSDLLFVAQLESGSLALEHGRAHLGDVVDEAVENARLSAEQHSLTITSDVDQRLPPFRGDGDRLGQALDNLLSNAIKYSPDGGTIEVRAYELADEIVLSVTDHGIGIAPEDAEQLFDRFFRGATATESQIQGVGLGLSIVKAIAEGHGGRLTVDSEEGAGSTFALHLPAEQVNTDTLKPEPVGPKV